MIVALLIFFFFNDTATTEIYTLSLHDALPISRLRDRSRHEYRVARRQPHVLVLAHMRQIDADARRAARGDRQAVRGDDQDRKSTRLNSSHSQISYAVFCLKKKKYHDIHRSIHL